MDHQDIKIDRSSHEFANLKADEEEAVALIEEIQQRITKKMYCIK